MRTSIDLKMVSLTGRVAVAVMLAAGMLFLAVNSWPVRMMAIMGEGPADVVSRALLPKAAIAVAWDRYELGRFQEAADLACRFNAWQPTVETLLLEGRCLQTLGRTKPAEALYRRASQFDPHSRSARLALIGLSLEGLEAGAAPTAERVDAILEAVPWDDGEAIQKIAVRFLVLAEQRTGADRLPWVAPVLYLSPPEPILRRAGAALLMDPTVPPEARRIGAHLVATTLVAENGRLPEGDLHRLDALLPDWAGVEEKVAMEQGRIRWLSFDEYRKIGAKLEFPAGIPAEGMAPICKAVEWRRHLGGILRALHAQS